MRNRELLFARSNFDSFRLRKDRAEPICNGPALYKSIRAGGPVAFCARLMCQHNLLPLCLKSKTESKQQPQVKRGWRSSSSPDRQPTPPPKSQTFQISARFKSRVAPNCFRLQWPEQLHQFLALLASASQSRWRVQHRARKLGVNPCCPGSIIELRRDLKLH